MRCSIGACVCSSSRPLRALHALEYYCGLTCDYHPSTHPCFSFLYWFFSIRSGRLSPVPSFLRLTRSI